MSITVLKSSLSGLLLFVSVIFLRLEPSVVPGDYRLVASRRLSPFKVRSMAAFCRLWLLFRILAIDEARKLLFFRLAALWVLTEMGCVTWYTLPTSTSTSPCFGVGVRLCDETRSLSVL